MDFAAAIEVAIWDSEFSEPVISEGTHDDFGYLGSKFYLSGGMRTVTPNAPGVDDDYEEVAGHNYLFYLPDIQEFEHSAANQRTKEVRIYWYPDLLDSFQSSFEKLSTPLQQLREGYTNQQFHKPLGAMTPAMRLALQQILECAFREALKQMYLEGKALELLILQIAQWRENDRLLCQSLCFRPDEIERLHHAKVILQTLQSPPSLLGCVIN